jgi:toxin ParE1/3/4
LNAAFVFHPEAEAELREIVRYTVKQWGVAQAKKYAATLRQCIQALATMRDPSKT